MYQRKYLCVYFYIYHDPLDDKIQFFIPNPVIILSKKLQTDVSNYKTLCILLKWFFVFLSLIETRFHYFEKALLFILYNHTIRLRYILRSDQNRKTTQNEPDFQNGKNNRSRNYLIHIYLLPLSISDSWKQINGWMVIKKISFMQKD